MIRSAVIMAGGLGTRMRRTDDTATLEASQVAAAESGVKGMIPIKRPFLEYVLSALADAGIVDVLLVIGPDHDAVRQYFTREAPPTRVRLRFVVQPAPIGTANAVTVAAAVLGDAPFLVLNADNYYPVAAFRELATEDSAGVVAFDREVLVRDGNIDAERVRAYAVLDLSRDGMLCGILEKPGDAFDLTSDAAKWVGMNLWAVTPAIVEACHRVPVSARGEFELPEAVALALREGVPVRAVRLSAPVLDLSRRSDIAGVVDRLSSVDPRP
ncbi:sugar phosphate nucleotidyltransferase [Gemmatimonas groenlandica]|uniref:NTP transferase domain-containing protein n=1 Tax=Gemmatimonas groenlandica TaxID=2732249 RepID=A0A6M4IKJ9_9BACT|nr:sugar phosphate nucleotidyltransferase [Gemmatimonas groenlandica]QJR34388.1 NTP transferase domain-containing protein [Gemmatimonas groenlandica]